MTRNAPPTSSCPRGARQFAKVNSASNVEERYAGWLAQQAQAGASFNEQQRWWLDCIADVIATSAGVTVEDLDNAPFSERGGVDGALRYLEQLNAELIA